MSPHETREAVKARFSGSGAEYDASRLGNPRGRLLSECDERLFLDLFPSGPDSLRVLEIGAGTGRFTLPVLRRGFRVTATDVNASMLETLREKVAELGAGDRCEIRIEDLFGLSFQNEQFDYVYGLHVIPRLLSLDDQRAALREIARTVRPGGRFLFNFRNARSPYRLRFKGHVTAPEQIEAFLAEGSMRIVEQRGKLLTSAMLINRLPMIVNRLVVRFDLAVSRIAATRAWDVFVVAEKSRAGVGGRGR